jgi:hypothetical protein
MHQVSISINQGGEDVEIKQDDRDVRSDLRDRQYGADGLRWRRCARNSSASTGSADAGPG